MEFYMMFETMFEDICSNLRNGTVEDVSSVNPVKLKGQVLATSSAKLGKNLKTKIVLN